MELNEQQLARFDEDGYVFFPQVFSAEEMEIINAEVPKVFAMYRDEVWREKETNAVRTAFAAHKYNDVFAKVAAHPRLVNPVMQLLGGPVYMHQNKINAKAAFDGDQWQWHQDFGTWHRDDLMPEPRAMNIALFLDDVTEFNGALMFLPGSHKAGVIDAGHDTLTTSYPLWTLDKKTVTEMADARGIVSPKGPAGSVVVFHSNLVHASPGNISPYDRTINYLSLCHVDNHIRRYKRAEWIAHRDFTAIVPLADDCLLERSVAAAE